MGDDGGDICGAETRGDGGERGGGGTVPHGGEEVAAVAEQNAEGVAKDGKVAGMILGRIGRRGWTGSVGYVGFHVCMYN
jgi:hypothetical protein